MGLDPEHSDYEPGVPCPVCNDVIFGGITPKYVHIQFSGIMKCPGTERAALNRGFVLTQTDNPCVWEWHECRIDVRWSLDVALTECQLWNTDHFEFEGRVFSQCRNELNNIMFCGAPLSFYYGGKAVVTWGTDIGPPPFYRSEIPGLICENCVDDIFDGTTPKHVLACVSGGSSCYPLFASYPRGPYLLTQDESSPCIWRRDTGTITVAWILNAANTTFLMQAEYGATRRYWFYYFGPPKCQSHMASQLVCGPGGPLGQGGNVDLFW